jgi:hypothetical protein
VVSEHEAVVIDGVVEESEAGGDRIFGADIDGTHHPSSTSGSSTTG